MPVTAMMRPLRTAREMPTFGSKGDPVETYCRWMLKVLTCKLNQIVRLNVEGCDSFFDRTLHSEIVAECSAVDKSLLWCRFVPPPRLVSLKRSRSFIPELARYLWAIINRVDRFLHSPGLALFEDTEGDVLGRSMQEADGSCQRFRQLLTSVTFSNPVIAGLLGAGHSATI